MSEQASSAALTAWLTEHAEAADGTLPVSEIFGPTIQGEGPHAGRATWFIRLGGCNLSCVWCDTPYATGQHDTPMAAIARHSVRDILRRLPTDHMVVITGGEPLMHLAGSALPTLLHGLKELDMEVHVETNGMFMPAAERADLIDHFTVSPKLSVAMRHDRHQPRLGDWHCYQEKTVMKWVIDDLDAPGALERLPQRLSRVRKTSRAHGITANRVWVMPEGGDVTRLQRHWAAIAQAAADAGINATHRLHTLAWGDARGR